MTVASAGHYTVHQSDGRLAVTTVNTGIELVVSFDAATQVNKLFCCEADCAVWLCSEMAAFQQQQYATSLQSVPGHPVFLQSQIVQRPTSKYLNVAGHPPGMGQVCIYTLFSCVAGCFCMVIESY